MSPNVILGGLFGWEFPAVMHDRLVPPWLQGRHLRLVNARSGLRLLAEHLQPAKIWLPAYLCESILGGLAPFEGKLQFYPVDVTHNISSPEWLENVKAKDLVLVIDYFGWRPEKSLLDQIHGTGAYILEDASQAILTAGVGKGADYSLYSPRKFVAVPDGGVLRAEGISSLPDVSLQQSPSAWWFQAFHAVMLRGEFDRHGGDRAWFKVFQSTENNSPIGSYGMSEFSDRALQAAFAYEVIASARIRNYHFLVDYLGEWALRRNLPEGTVPLGFPIRIFHRDKIRQRLFDCGVYPAIHWPIPAAVPAGFADSRRLAAEIMTLPCDQRYGLDDMARMADIIRETIRA